MNPKKLMLIFCAVLRCCDVVNGQKSRGGMENYKNKTVDEQNTSSVEDPSQFFSRIEIFNEVEHFNNNVYTNQTTFRGVVKVGKRFTTRIDIPVVYNSYSTTTDAKHFGIGDISFRILGYKLMQTKKSAMTLSLECSLNTAQSELLGTGKNMLIPVLSYTRSLTNSKALLSIVFQQVNSFSGDEKREDVIFSKIQLYFIKPWSKKVWTVFVPTMYVDYVNGGSSMIVETRMTTAIKPRTNFWIQAGAGLYGDFILRYQWSAQIGFRYGLSGNRKADIK